MTTPASDPAETHTDAERAPVAGLLVWGTALVAMGATVFTFAQQSWLLNEVHFWESSTAEVWMLAGGLIAAIGVVLVLTGAYRGAKMLEDLHARVTKQD